jgi:hypothetical protein
VAGLVSSWLVLWRLRKAVGRYVAWLWEEPSPQDVQWVAGAATNGDADRAAWELRYAKRALGLLVAERDALDDRTPSLVAQEITIRTKLDRNVAPGMVALAERQFDERLKVYRDAVLEVPASQLDAEALGRAFATTAAPGVSLPADVVARLGTTLLGYLLGANEMLRSVVGAAALPEDLPPSALARR